MKAPSKHPCIVRSLGALAVLVIASCATPQQVDHRAYEKTPDVPSSLFWRAVAHSNPYSASRAYHGNWGGPGNRGGEPVDRIDEGCRRHDIVYCEARSRSVLRRADQSFVEWLESIDESALSEEDREYRQRAIDFFNSPLSNLVGKSPLLWLRFRERENGPFQSGEDVEAFFDADHPGFPELEPVVVP